MSSYLKADFRAAWRGRHRVVAIGDVFGSSEVVVRAVAGRTLRALRGQQLATMLEGRLRFKAEGTYAHDAMTLGPCHGRTEQTRRVVQQSGGDADRAGPAQRSSEARLDMA